MATEKRPLEGRWADLAPEILALIFVLIPADEMSRTVPLVCSAWREAAVGPYCWAEIDIESWCHRVSNVEIIDRAVRKLVRRSRSSCRRVAAYRIGDSCFPAIASAGKFLSILQIPMSEITDGMVEKHAPSLTALTVLDISYCLKITFKGIEALGKHCKFLVQLRRNMVHSEFDFSQQGGPQIRVEEEEAISVANTMPSLEHLEFARGLFTDHGLNAILTKCRALRLLNIRGCMNVELEGNIKHMCDMISDFGAPWEDQFDFELDRNNAAAMWMKMRTSDEDVDEDEGMGDEDEGMSDEDEDEYEYEYEYMNDEDEDEAAGTSDEDEGMSDEDGCLVDVDTSDDVSEYD